MEQGSKHQMLRRARGENTTTQGSTAETDQRSSPLMRVSNSWSTPDNYGLEPSEKTSEIFCDNFCQARRTWGVRRNEENDATGDVRRCAAARSDTSPGSCCVWNPSDMWHLRCQHDRETDRQTAGENLRHVPVYCRRNIVHKRRGAIVVGPLLQDEVYEVKSLNGDGASSLSQSAPLGRLDCNESSQSKRDLLATAGEPALATCPLRRATSLRVRAARRRTVRGRAAGRWQGEKHPPLCRCASSGWTVMRGRASHRGRESARERDAAKSNPARTGGNLSTRYSFFRNKLRKKKQKKQMLCISDLCGIVRAAAERETPREKNKIKSR